MSLKVGLRLTLQEKPPPVRPTAGTAPYMGQTRGMQSLCHTLNITICISFRKPIVIIIYGLYCILQGALKASRNTPSGYEPPSLKGTFYMSP